MQVSTEGQGDRGVDYGLEQNLLPLFQIEEEEGREVVQRISPKLSDQISQNQLEGEIILYWCVFAYTEKQ